MRRSGTIYFAGSKARHLHRKTMAAGFETSTLTVELSDVDRTLSVSLEVATLRQEVTVEDQVSAHANNDPFYRQLRDAS